MTAAVQSACGVEISLRIGQRVRHRDYAGQRVTGVVRSLQIESEQGLTATVLLDEPIIIPARGEGDREIRINWQTCAVQEFTPFDERDEQIAELLAALTLIADGEVMSGAFTHLDTVIEYQRIARTAVAKVEGPSHV